MRLEGGPLKTEWWSEIATNYVAYLNVTTNIDTSPDQGMLGEKGGSGFPYMVFMDHEGAVLKTVRAFIRAEGSFQTFSKETILEDQADAEQELAKLTALREKAKKNPGDKLVRATLVIEIALRHGGNASIEDLKQAAATPGVDKLLTERFEDFLAEKQAQNRMDTAVKMMSAEADQGIGRKQAIAYLQVEYTKLFKSGLRLAATSRLNGQFLNFVMQAAVKAKDVETATAVVAAATATDNDRMAEHLNRQLQDLKDSLESDDKKGDDTRDDGD